jgi:RNA polymerase sigma-70 factor, ECF subfamily
VPTVEINDTILIGPSSSIRPAVDEILCLLMFLLEHADGLFSYAYALTRNVHEAEDLVQETYLRAIAAMDRFREDGNAKAWLYTILRNIRLNQVRQQRIKPKLLELDAHEDSADLLVEAGKDPHTLYVSKMEIRQLRAAIQQLSEEFREIILLREFAELSYKEIATVLGCAPGTVMSRMARARRKLRTLLLPTKPRSQIEEPIQRRNPTVMPRASLNAGNGGALET